MLLEKAIETAIINRLAQLPLTSAQITGGWQSAAVGTVKTENADTLCQISVIAKPRSYETYLMPSCEVGVDIEVSIRDELAPTGAEVADYFEPIANLLQSWQRSIDTVRSDLVVSGFGIAGIRLDGGDTLHDSSSSRSVITQSVTIKGVIQ